MIFESARRVYLTRSELNDLRRQAARYGHCVNQIRTPADLLRAVLDSLPPERQAALLAFLEKDQKQGAAPTPSG